MKLICPQELVPSISDFLIWETTTIGVRWRVESRIKADRSIEERNTRYGPLKFKVARIGEKIVNVAPEYDHCKQVALERNVPLKHVMEAAGVVAAAATVE